MSVVKRVVCPTDDSLMFGIQCRRGSRWGLVGTTGDETVLLVPGVVNGRMGFKTPLRTEG